jgi:uncharacterized protein (DUF362 family)
MHSVLPCIDRLAALSHPEGGWGYSPGQPAHLEPTCLGLLALSLEPEAHAAVFARALAVLEGCSAGDGTYRLARGREEAVWPTALVLFVEETLDGKVEDRGRTAGALLRLRGQLPDRDPEVAIHDIDLKITGWPWGEGNFSWVEPTAWACLALRRAGHGEHERVRDGLRLLLDRTFDQGGINYGNRVVLGRPLEPVPGPTAISLLALQGHGDEPRVQASVRYLQNEENLGSDLEHLCWARLALTVYRDQPGVAGSLAYLDECILAAYRDRPRMPYLQAAPLREALTALALAADRTCPFLLPPDLPVCPVAEAGRPRRRSLGERFRSAIEGLAVTAVGALRTVPAQTQVHIGTASDYNDDLAGVVCRQYEAFREKVPLQGKRVVLKPNLVEYHRDKVINTNPNVVAAAIELCQREGAAEVIVAEGPGHWRNAEYLVAASGLGEVLRHYKVPFVDLNHDEPVKRPNLGRLTGLSHLYLTRTIDSADVVISLPKMKTHHWAVATLSLKNLFGTLPGICYGWPKNELHWRGIDNSIVDIALTRTPDLAIVDGIIGMEGDGPLNGTPRHMGVLVMGNDLVAVDATCCRLMQLDPEKIRYLLLGAMKKLGRVGVNQIEQIGEPIDSLSQPFETLECFQTVDSVRPDAVCGRRQCRSSPG